MKPILENVARVGALSASLFGFVACSVILGINPAGISTIWNASSSIVGVPQYRQLVATAQPQNATSLRARARSSAFAGSVQPNGVPNVVAATGYN